jgi:Zn-dependent M16 (insulinase) family peptidase
MHDMLYQPNFSEDEEHIKTNLLAYCSHLSNSLQDSGHRFALSYAAAQTGIASAVRSEELGGIAYVELLNQIVSNEQGKSIAWVIQNLTSISSKLSKSVGVERYALTGDSHGLQSCSEMFERSRLFDQVQPASFPLKSTSTLNNLDSTFKGSKQTFIGLPIQVNHAAMCIPTVPCTHPDSSKLRLLGSLMSSFYLHREVREKGGAYGSGARQSSDGLFSFFSFRDPNCEKTIDVFKESCKWASGKTESTFSDQDIQESTLKLFSSIDSPSSPGQRGMGYFKSRISKEFALEERHRLLSITRDDLVDVANRYLVQAIDSEKSRVAVVGRKDSAPKSSSSWEFKSLGKSR